MKEAKVEYCPRCHEDHGNVMFKKFRGNPISSDGWDFNYWGWCPAYLEPIIFYVDEDHEEIADSRTSEEETKEGEHRPICGCTSECEDSQSCLNEAESVPTN